VTSFGLREFDALLLSSSSSSSSSTSLTPSHGGGGGGSGGGGGGQPLRTSILIEEDRLSDDLSRCLCRYWLAEGVSQDQRVLLVGTSSSCVAFDAVGECDYDEGGVMMEEEDGCTPEELRELLFSLPRNMHVDKVRSSSERRHVNGRGGAGDGGDGGGGGDENDRRDGDGIVRGGGRGREPISAIVEEDEDEDEDEDEEGCNDDDDRERNHDDDYDVIDGGHDDVDDDVDDGGKDGNDEGLINAWQYRKSIQDARRGIGGAKRGGVGGGIIASNTAMTGGVRGVYCHSYDLSKRMWDQFATSSSSSSSLSAPSTANDDVGCRRGDDGETNPILANATIVDCSYTLSSSSTATSSHVVGRRMRGIDLFRRIWHRLESTMRSQPNVVIRLFLPRLPVGIGSIMLPLLMSKIRGENMSVVVLVTIRPWRWLSSPIPSDDGEYDAVNKLDALSSLRQSADVALSVDSFSSLRVPPPPEFALLRGILTLRKCAPRTSSHYADAIVSKRPLADRFGVKRDGRKLTLQLLHLPPEDYGVRSSTGGAVRSVGGGGAAVVPDIDREDHQHPRGGGGNFGRSVTGGGCSSLGAGGASLDF
jgi:hypothetical protein